jgi:hypothetical protein
MRILLSFEKEHRVYMDAMAAAIRLLRPDVEIAVCDGEDLESELERLDPQLVITSHPVPENLADDRLGRIDLSPEPARPSRFRVGERYWESTNPTLDETLSVVDETDLLYRRPAREAKPIDNDGEA